MATKNIKLPSGETVELRDAKDLKHKDRLRLFSNIDDELNSTERALLIMDNMVGILIASWSFDLMLPSIRRETLGELSIADMNVLNEYAQEALPALTSVTNKTAETEQDPKADTGNSNT